MPRQQSGLYEFKPSDLGMGGTYSGLDAYKNALKKAVDSQAVEISQIGPQGPNIPSYLKWTIDNMNGKTSFGGNNPSQMREFFKNWGDRAEQHYKKMLVYWAENLGPIYLMTNHPDVFPKTSKVFIPTSVSEGLWDFKVNDSEISVKAPKGATNVIKPQDIVANKELKKRIFKSDVSESVKKLYRILKILAEERAVPGPVKVLYGTTGSNGELSADFPDLAIKTPTPPSIVTDYAVQRARWKETEKAISSWGKSKIAAPAVKLLTSNFLKYSGLTLLKMDIPKATGIPDFSWGSNLTKAELKGKGKLGERMGIGISFDNKFYTSGF